MDELDSLGILKSIMHISVPSLFNLIMTELVVYINMIFIGKLNNEEMIAGVGIAYALICGCAVSLTLGLSGVLETLVS